MLGTQFYNASIRNSVAAFGTIFNDIYVETEISAGNTELYRVPLTYSPKMKWEQRTAVTSSTYTSAEVQTSVPRMGFEYTALSYDAERKLNTMQKTGVDHSTDVGRVVRRYMRVPYNMDFSLYVLVGNSEDGLKIVEQILPYFTPDFVISINDVIKTDMPITLNDVSFEDSWSGDMDSRRRIEWTLTFTAKTYLYGPAQEQEIIKNVVTQFYDHTDPATVDAMTSPRGTVTNAASRFEYDSDEDLTITINSQLS